MLASPSGPSSSSAGKWDEDRTEQSPEGALDSLAHECRSSDCVSDGSSPNLCAGTGAEGPQRSPRNRACGQDADLDDDDDIDGDDDDVGRDADVHPALPRSRLLSSFDDAAQRRGSAESSADDYLAAHEEGSTSTQSAPPSPSSRYHGHPLGLAALEIQQEQIARHHRMMWEERTQHLRCNGWTVMNSAARAKILVSEAYFLERARLLEQLRWLDTPPARRQATPRFKQEFHYPDACFLTLPAEVLADDVRHREVVLDRLRGLADRWRDIGRQVAQQMAHSDEFCDVIRNLSTMRIFLEGQQAQRYGIDAAQQHRRMARYQSVLDLLQARQAGLFLTDALPRPGELAGHPRGPCPDGLPAGPSSV